MAESNANLIVQTGNDLPDISEESFGNMLAALVASEPLADPDLNWAEFLGEIRGKVDRIKFYLEKLEDLETFLETQMQPIAKAKRKVAAAHKNLEAYVTYHMVTNGLEKVPGHLYRVQLNNNPPALELKKAEPTADDYAAFPDYVEMERRYVWRKDRIKADLLEGKITPETFPHASIRRGRRAHFDVNTPEKKKTKQVKGRPE